LYESAVYGSEKAKQGWSITKTKMAPVTAKVSEKLAPVIEPVKQSVLEGSTYANE